MSSSYQSMALIAAIALAGCSGATNEGDTPAADEVSEAGHSHGGWWCGEHGVPEAECALCDVKLVAEFKAQGDWCTEHNRPDSQCFVCHPEKQAEYAALYEAKYGEAPPPIGTPHADDEDHDHPDS